ncbi:hypothetical protein ABIB25_005669 [Nakamurella sp. UYEF19]|uniref:hypothetical protein n=1 Tax=Nakamurella sp. UYEF19 TaxID=1756392 RepID=UPI00339403EA
MLLIGGGIYLTHLLLAGRPGSEPTRSTPDSRPQNQFDGSTYGSTEWSALDDLQLNRLLDESSP